MHLQSPKAVSCRYIEVEIKAKYKAYWKQFYCVESADPKLSGVSKFQAC